MKARRVAIVGGGLSGLTLAYELTSLAPWCRVTLFERTARLGGTIESVQRDGFVIECGPDSWVSEKPWARELACELGLQNQLLSSNDATRRTYILQHGRLIPMPDGMRLMVPTDLDAASRSPLFTPAALQAFQQEIARAADLKANAPLEDESVARFVERHFGSEVLHTVAAPLLSGVFGGDVRELSARAVLPQLVAIERRYGSLILGLQQGGSHTAAVLPSPGSAEASLAETETNPRARAIFTTLRDGLGTLIQALAERIPASAVHLRTAVERIRFENGSWAVTCAPTNRGDDVSPASQSAKNWHEERFDAIVLATPLDVSRRLLTAIDPDAAAQLPTHASSAVTIAFAWADARLSPLNHRRTEQALFTPPPGFGFLVPPRRGIAGVFGPQILAATFADQKFPGRAPEGGRLIRVFYGGAAADRLWHLSDAHLEARALDELRSLLGVLPVAAPIAVLRRWRHSLPQYTVGHLERAAELDRRLEGRHGLFLLGNALRGVGLPDLVREARLLAQTLIT